MKKELEEILRNCAIDIHNNWAEAQDEVKKDWHSEHAYGVFEQQANKDRELYDKYYIEIISLFNKTIEDSKDEIINYFSSFMKISYADKNLICEGVLTIIKNKKG